MYMYSDKFSGLCFRNLFGYSGDRYIFYSKCVYSRFSGTYTNVKAALSEF